MKLSATQLRCLESPVRIEIYEAIRSIRRVTVAELAEHLGRTVHSLYYHVNAMVGAGLIRVTEYRRSGKKDEAVYEAVSDRLVFDKSTSNPAYRESLIRSVRVALRKAEREHARSRQARTPGEDFGLLRLKARLKEEDAREFQKKLESLGKWVRRRDQEPGETEANEYSVTCLFVPLSD